MTKTTNPPLSDKGKRAVLLDPLPAIKKVRRVTELVLTEFTAAHEGWAFVTPDGIAVQIGDSTIHDSREGAVCELGVLSDRSLVADDGRVFLMDFNDDVEVVE